MVKCKVCGKEYKSRSGLRRHVKSKHPGDASPSEVVTKSQASGVEAVQRPQKEYVADGEAFKAACKELGIAVKDVMAYKVYDDRVVIIEGPVGFKRVWQRA